MANKITHLIKLSVGSESVDSLAAWQKQKRAQTDDGLPRHVTRMWPRRETEVLDGGSNSHPNNVGVTMPEKLSGTRTSYIPAMSVTGGPGRPSRATPRASISG